MATTNLRGQTLVHDDAPPAHAAMLLRGLQDQAAAVESLLGTLLPPTASSRKPVLDLSSGTGAGTLPSVQILVEEGDYFYPVAHPHAGWGSLLGAVRTAHVHLVRVDETGQRRVAATAEVRTDPDRPFGNAVILARAAELLATRPCLRGGNSDATSLPSAMRVPQVGWGEHVRRVVGRVGHALVRRMPFWQWPHRRQWTIGVLSSAAATVGPEFPWPAVRWLQPPRDGYIADPFLVRDEERLWLFYEKLKFHDGKGTLWVAELTPEAPALRAERQVMEQPFHLSFPNVFRADGHWFMLPEQASSDAIMLYRAVDFPNRWEPVCKVLDGFAGIDPVLFQHDGRWWLMATFGTFPCNENNLQLFSSDRLEGPYEPHPMNPIRTGLHGSRMAGPVFMEGGRLIRPGQDGRTGYGQGVALFEIVRLDAQQYIERELCTWSPPTGHAMRDGFHSYVPCGKWIAVDGQRRGRPSAPLAA